MPFSSSSLTSVASEKRGGGCVNFCSGRSSLSSSRSPSASGGSTPDTPSSSSSGSPSTRGRRFRRRPSAPAARASGRRSPSSRRTSAPCPSRGTRSRRAATSTVVSSKVAGFICDATNRFQINRYKRVLIRREIRLHRLGIVLERRRPDRFVRVLRVRLRLVEVRLLRQVVGAERPARCTRGPPRPPRPPRGPNRFACR